MGSSPPTGIPGWDPSIESRSSKSDRGRSPYRRSIPWAVAAWIVSLLAVFLISEGGLPQLGGWLGLAGLIFGIWFGGTMGAVKGPREWAVVTAILLAIAFLALGLGSCVYAMALYG